MEEMSGYRDTGFTIHFPNNRLYAVGSTLYASLSK